MSVFFDVNGQSNGHFSSIYGPIVKVMKGDIAEEINIIRSNAKELESTGIDQIIEDKQLIIDGKNVHKIVIASSIGYNVASYYFAGNEINYVIDIDNDNSIHSDIVSTFRFTD